MLTRDQLHAYLSAGIQETAPGDELDALVLGLQGQLVPGDRFPEAGRRVVALAGTQPGCGLCFYGDPQAAARRQQEHAARGLAAEVAPWQVDALHLNGVVGRVRQGQSKLVYIPAHALRDESCLQQLDYLVQAPGVSSSVLDGSLFGDATSFAQAQADFEATLARLPATFTVRVAPGATASVPMPGADGLSSILDRGEGVGADDLDAATLSRILENSDAQDYGADSGVGGALDAETLSAILADGEPEAQENTPSLDLGDGEELDGETLSRILMRSDADAEDDYVSVMASEVQEQEPPPSGVSADYGTYGMSAEDEESLSRLLADDGQGWTPSEVGQKVSFEDNPELGAVTEALLTDDVSGALQQLDGGQSISFDPAPAQGAVTSALLSGDVSQALDQLQPPPAQEISLDPSSGSGSVTGALFQDEMSQVLESLADDDSSLSSVLGGLDDSAVSGVAATSPGGFTKVDTAPPVPAADFLANTSPGGTVPGATTSPGIVPGAAPLANTSPGGTAPGATTSPGEMVPGPAPVPPASPEGPDLDTIDPFAVLMDAPEMVPEPSQEELADKLKTAAGQAVVPDAAVLSSLFDPSAHSEPPRRPQAPTGPELPGEVGLAGLLGSTPWDPSAEEMGERLKTAAGQAILPDAGTLASFIRPAEPADPGAQAGMSTSPGEARVPTREEIAARLATDAGQMEVPDAATLSSIFGGPESETASVGDSLSQFLDPPSQEGPQTLSAALVEDDPLDDFGISQGSLSVSDVLGRSPQPTGDVETLSGIFTENAPSDPGAETLSAVFGGKDSGVESETISDILGLSGGAVPAAPLDATLSEVLAQEGRSDGSALGSDPTVSDILGNQSGWPSQTESATSSGGSLGGDLDLAAAPPLEEGLMPAPEALSREQMMEEFQGFEGGLGALAAGGFDPSSRPEPEAGAVSRMILPQEEQELAAASGTAPPAPPAPEAGSPLDFQDTSFSDLLQAPSQPRAEPEPGQVTHNILPGDTDLESLSAIFGGVPDLQDGDDAFGDQGLDATLSAVFGGIDSEPSISELLANSDASDGDSNPEGLASDLQSDVDSLLQADRALQANLPSVEDLGKLAAGGFDASARPEPEEGAISRNLLPGDDLQVEADEESLSQILDDEFDISAGSLASILDMAGDASHELDAAPDLVAAPDQALDFDLAAAPELAPAPEMAPAPDLDLAAAPELAEAPDLAPAPEMDPAFPEAPGAGILDSLEALAAGGFDATTRPEPEAGEVSRMILPQEEQELGLSNPPPPPREEELDLGFSEAPALDLEEDSGESLSQILDLEMDLGGDSLGAILGVDGESAPEAPPAEAPGAGVLDSLEALAAGGFDATTRPEPEAGEVSRMILPQEEQELGLSSPPPPAFEDSSPLGEPEGESLSQILDSDVSLQLYSEVLSGAPSGVDSEVTSDVPSSGDEEDSAAFDSLQALASGGFDATSRPEPEAGEVSRMILPQEEEALGLSSPPAPPEPELPDDEPPEDDAGESLSQILDADALGGGDLESILGIQSPDPAPGTGGPEDLDFGDLGLDLSGAGGSGDEFDFASISLDPLSEADPGISPEASGALDAPAEPDSPFAGLDLELPPDPAEPAPPLDPPAGDDPLDSLEALAAGGFDATSRPEPEAGEVSRMILPQEEEALGLAEEPAPGPSGGEILDPNLSLEAILGVGELLPTGPSPGSDVFASSPEIHSDAQEPDLSSSIDDLLSDSSLASSPGLEEGDPDFTDSPPPLAIEEEPVAPPPPLFDDLGDLDVPPPPMLDAPGELVEPPSLSAGDLDLALEDPAPAGDPGNLSHVFAQAAEVGDLAPGAEASSSGQGAGDALAALEEMASGDGDWGALMGGEVAADGAEENPFDDLEDALSAMVQAPSASPRKEPSAGEISRNLLPGQELSVEDLDATLVAPSPDAAVPGLDESGTGADGALPGDLGDFSPDDSGDSLEVLFGDLSPGQGMSLEQLDEAGIPDIPPGTGGPPELVELDLPEGFGELDMAPPGSAEAGDPPSEGPPASQVDLLADMLPGDFDLDLDMGGGAPPPDLDAALAHMALNAPDAGPQEPGLVTSILSPDAFLEEPEAPEPEANLEDSLESLMMEGGFGDLASPEESGDGGLVLEGLDSPGGAPPPDILLPDFELDLDSEATATQPSLLALSLDPGVEDLSAPREEGAGSQDGEPEEIDLLAGLEHLSPSGAPEELDLLAGLDEGTLGEPEEIDLLAGLDAGPLSGEPEEIDLLAGLDGDFSPGSPTGEPEEIDLLAGLEGFGDPGLSAPTPDLGEAFPGGEPEEVDLLGDLELPGLDAGGPPPVEDSGILGELELLAGFDPEPEAPAASGPDAMSGDPLAGLDELVVPPAPLGSSDLSDLEIEEIPLAGAAAVGAAAAGAAALGVETSEDALGSLFGDLADFQEDGEAVPSLDLGESQPVVAPADADALDDLLAAPLSLDAEEPSGPASPEGLGDALDDLMALGGEPGGADQTGSSDAVDSLLSGIDARLAEGAAPEAGEPEGIEALGDLVEEDAGLEVPAPPLDLEPPVPVAAAPAPRAPRSGAGRVQEAFDLPEELEEIYAGSGGDLRAIGSRLEEIWKRDDEIAFQHLQMVVDIGKTFPGDKVARYAEGTVHLLRNRRYDGLAALRRAAELAQAEGDLMGVGHLLEELRERMPDDPGVGEALAEHYQGSNRHEEARRVYEELGEQALEMGLSRDAVAHLERAHGLQPGSPAVSAKLLRAFHSLGAEGRALEFCNDFLSTRPNSPVVLVHQGLAYQRMAKLQEARKSFDRAFDKAWHDVSRLEAIYQEVREAGDEDLKQRAVDRILELDPENQVVRAGRLAEERARALERGEMLEFVPGSMPEVEEIPEAPVLEVVPGKGSAPEEARGDVFQQIEVVAPRFSSRIRELGSLVADLDSGEEDGIPIDDEQLAEVMRRYFGLVDALGRDTPEEARLLLEHSRKFLRRFEDPTLLFLWKEQIENRLRSSPEGPQHAAA